MNIEARQVLPGVYWSRGKGQPSSVISATACISATRQYIRITGLEGCISFTPGRMDKRSPAWLEVLSVNVVRLIEKYSIPNGEVIWPLQPQDKSLLTHVFEACENDDLEMLRVRTAELFITLTRLNVAECVSLPADRDLSPRGAVTARSVHSYLINHMSDHVTIDELSSLFNISKTQIKEWYRMYYGAPLGRHIKEEKLRIAAYMLRSTGRTVADIASSCGYSNPAKFSKAFAGMYSVNPSEYRKQ